MSKQFKGFDKEWLEKQSANKVWGNNFGDLSNEELENLKKGFGPKKSTKNDVKKKTHSNTAKKAPKKKNEQKLSIAVSNYLKLQFPNTVFCCDSSGVKLTMGQAVSLKKQRSVHKIPDMIILEPSPNGVYHFMVLELKTIEATPYLKNGSLSKSEHIQEQNKTLELLRTKGAYAEFAVGIDDAISKIKGYFQKHTNQILNHE